MKPKQFSFSDPQLLAFSLRGAITKANPFVLWRNPVIFVTEIGALVSTLEIFLSAEPKFFTVQISLWLWFTVLFSTFAEAIAESRGKAQADSLRQARTITLARRLREGREETVSATELRKGDLVVCVAGDLIPADGEVTQGAATVDESAVTGESAPVVRESGGDRSGVTGGTKVISDRIVIQITSDPGQTFLDRMIQLVEGAKRQKTPNEIALGILLAALTFIFLLVILTLVPFLHYLDAPVSIATLAALVVCLIPTTIGGLLSAIGIAGIDRLVQHNVMATSGRAVEAA
ncbi:MAG: HAD-IC family P-type ATPase, partial [Methylacidiphilaceae bacterium]|nr:HAD-IC family P-type ATPase [Candidatus Methylacidiphilaceae bacterium]